MTPETLRLDQPESRIDAARREFNLALLSRDFDGRKLLDSLITVQNSLYQSVDKLTPEEIFHELVILSGQAIERANMQPDEQVITTLKSLREGYRITRENFTPKRVVSQTQPQPTATETLPPMIGAKGATGTTQAKSSGVVTQPKPEIQEPEQEIKLTKREQEVLDVLKQATGPVSKEELAQKLNVAPASASSYISMLKNRGVKIDAVRESEQSKKVVGYQLTRVETQQEENNIS